MERNEGASLELVLDLRRLLPLNTLLIHLAVVLEDDDASVSLALPPDELDEPDEIDEPSISASTPGWDSSSITCCGVLWYMYACDFSWKSKYKTYTSSNIF
jgi:hypothetical protein